MVPVLLIVSVIAFALLYVLPGDPAVAILGDSAGNQQTYLALRHDLGLDQPLSTQYLSWLGRVLQGDLGRSIRTNEAVSTVVLQRVPRRCGVGRGPRAGVVGGGRLSAKTGESDRLFRHPAGDGWRGHSEFLAGPAAGVRLRGGAALAATQWLHFAVCGPALESAHVDLARDCPGHAFGRGDHAPGPFGVDGSAGTGLRCDRAGKRPW